MYSLLNSNLLFLLLILSSFKHQHVLFIISSSTSGTIFSSQYFSGPIAIVSFHVHGMEDIYFGLQFQSLWRCHYKYDASVLPVFNHFKIQPNPPFFPISLSLYGSLCNNVSLLWFQQIIFLSAAKFPPTRAILLTGVDRNDTDMCTVGLVVIGLPL